MTDGAQDRRTDVDREIVLDIWHLSLGFARETPAGVDRVDMSFAAHFLTADIPNRKALLLTPLGPRAVRVAGARRIFEGVQTHWRRDRATGVRWRPRARAQRAGGALSTANIVARVFAERAHRAFRTGGGAALLHCATWRYITGIGTNAVYLNVSQYPLSAPSYFRWLRERPDVKPVFMIHDLLPIEYPEFFRPESVERHRRRLSVFAKIAAGAIVSTQEVADALLAYAPTARPKDHPIARSATARLTDISSAARTRRGLAARPYFVICGTIESRVRTTCCSSTCGANSDDYWDPPPPS